MRKVLAALGAVAIVAFGLALLNPDFRARAQSNAACYMAQGGASWVLGSGCTQTVASGGIINVAAGGALKFASVDQTAALATAPAAVAAGYKIARGVTALDGSNPTSVDTGLTTIVSCPAALKATAAPNLSTSVVTTNFSTGQLDIYGWKPTSAASPNLTASTGTENVTWFCIGT